MSGFLCTEHPGAPALFSCDGCARLLCPDCTREGHRLFFCRHCGERAVAMEVRASSSVTERKRAEKIERPYSIGEALAYAFRGSGRPMLPLYVLCMTVAALLPGFGGAIGYLIQLLLPGLLFEIARTTSEGEVELPEWPDYSDFFERVKEGLWMLAIQATALVPMALFFYLSDCDLLSFLLGATDSTCWGPVAGGIALGTMIGAFAFGATGCHSSPWLTFRIDLHLRALFSKAGPDGLKVAGLLTVFLLGGQFFEELFGGIPLLGVAVKTALSGYALFTGAHLVGLIFRRHRAVLDPIYRD
jgi:hypothetical protein